MRKFYFQVPLFFLASVLVLIVLKIFQVLRMSHEGVTSALVNYGSLNFMQAVNVGFLERIDDFSFWNTFAALIASICLLKALRELESVDPSLRAEIVRPDLGLKKLWGGLAIAYGAIYILLVAFDHNEFKGTFFVTTKDWVLRSIQYSEGVLNLGFTTCAAFMLALAVRFLVSVNRLTSFSNMRLEPLLPAVTWLLRSSFFATAVSLSAYLFVTKNLSGWEAYPGIAPVEKPLNMGSGIAAVFLWYGPYVAIFLAIWFLTKHPYRVRVGKIEPPFLDVSIEKVKVGNG